MENLGWGYVDNVDNSVDRFYYWKPSSTGIDKKAGKLRGFVEKVQFYYVNILSTKESTCLNNVRC